jgi:Protein of unknown function (DUF1152)
VAGAERRCRHAGRRRHVSYFPELALVHWLAERGLPSTVYALRRTGVQPLRAAYRNLVSSLGVDAIVLVDGGTDVLLRGDESRLGTPVEDIGSLAAVAGLDVPIKLVTCLGFGIDAYHGVNHVQVLETSRRSTATAAISARCPSPAAAARRPCTAMLWQPRKPRRRSGRASSTARSQRR